MLKLLILCFLGYVVTVSNASPAVSASYISPCKADDEPCIISSAQKALPHFAAGIPDLGVAPVDPLILDDVKSEEGDLKIQFKHLKVARTKECKFTKLTVGAEKAHLDLDMHCPITATGEYSVSGKLLVVPIEGEGDCEIKTEKIKISVRATMETIDGKDGKKHWNIANLDYQYEPEEQLYFRLDNLFGGNIEKATPVLEMLNKSGKEVILTIGKPIINEIVNKAKEHINSFLVAVPAEELFLQ